MKKEKVISITAIYTIIMIALTVIFGLSMLSFILMITGLIALIAGICSKNKHLRLAAWIILIGTILATVIFYILLVNSDM